MPNNPPVGNLKHNLIAARHGLRLLWAVNKWYPFLRYWLPTFVWMVLIFSASADAQSSQHSSTLFVPLLRWLFPGMSGAEIDGWHHLLRKCAHLTEYAILAFLVRRTLRHLVESLRAPWSARLVAAVITVVFLYAASDECHQTFVPGRTALVSDVLIDTSGGAAGLVLTWVVSRWIPRI
jgi:VanZ family protein